MLKNLHQAVPQVARSFSFDQDRVSRSGILRLNLARAAQLDPTIQGRLRTGFKTNSYGTFRTRGPKRVLGGFQLPKLTAQVPLL
jgi:hypothetical protein